jgi:hypothetical protein
LNIIVAVHVPLRRLCVSFSVGSKGKKMKALRIVVFVFAMLVLATQAVRHVYVRFIEPRTSVLDKFDQTETQKAIKSARSLDTLVTEYDSARKKTDELDKELKGMEQNKTKDEIEVIREGFRDKYKKEYERESDLKEAIREWETKSKEILELRVFWACGFALLLMGATLQARGFGWLGVSLVVPGIVEMIWWTSPSLRFGGSPLEFDRLLNNKLAFTLVTIAVLVCWWAIMTRRPEASNQTVQATAAKLSS